MNWDYIAQRFTQMMLINIIPKIIHPSRLEIYHLQTIFPIFNVKQRNDSYETGSHVTWYVSRGKLQHVTYSRYNNSTYHSIA